MVEVVLETPFVLREQSSLLRGQFLACVAERLGGEVTPQRVARLAEEMESRGIICHGVSRDGGRVERVRVEGVEPLTPETGFKSCWNEGMAVFGDDQKRESINRFYNSTLFRWARVSNVGTFAKTWRMVMAVSTVSKLLTGGHQVSGKGERWVAEIVRPEEMAFLEVEVPKGEKDDSEAVSLAERMMFELLWEDIMVNGGPSFGKCFKNEKLD